MESCIRINTIGGWASESIENKDTADSSNEIAVLAQKAKNGSKDSLEQLISRFHKDIFRMVYYRTRSQMDAEDLTQEIFLQIVRSLPTLRDANCFKAWLFRIALNRVRDFHRKKKLLAFISFTADPNDADQMAASNEGDPVNSMMRKQFWKQFYRFTDCLSRWEREIFVLRFVDHLEIREIAETLQKNENTVKTHLYRALKKFRQHPEFHDLLKGEMS